MEAKGQLVLNKLGYDEESIRSERLTRRLEICLLIVTLVTAAMLVKLDFVLEVARRNPITLGLMLFTCLLLLGGFVFGVVSLLFPSREPLFGPEDLESLGKNPGGSDPSFLASRTLTALHKTRQLNEKRETWLKVLTILMLGGVATAFIFLVAAALSAPQAKPAAPKGQPKTTASGPKSTASTSKPGKGAAKPTGSAGKTAQPANKPKK